MERPDEVNLSRQDGEALIERLQGDALTAQDRRVLEQVLRWYFWLLFALQEARFSLKRLRALVFGEKQKKRKTPPTAPSSPPQESDGEASAAGKLKGPSDRAPGGGGGRPGARRWGGQGFTGGGGVEGRQEGPGARAGRPVRGRGAV